MDPFASIDHFVSYGSLSIAFVNHIFHIFIPYHYVWNTIIFKKIINFVRI